MAHALVLNATYEPLSVVSARRAVVLLGRCIDHSYRAPARVRQEINVAALIRAAEQVEDGLPILGAHVALEADGKEIALATLGPGAIFGEMVFLKDLLGSRSASVRAAEDVVVLPYGFTFNVSDWQKARLPGLWKRDAFPVEMGAMEDGSGVKP